MELLDTTLIPTAKKDRMLLTLNYMSTAIAGGLVVYMVAMVQDVTEIVPLADRYGATFAACAIGLLFIFYWKHSQKQHKDLTDKLDALYQQQIKYLQEQAEK